MLLEKLQHIHESLCFESGIRASKSYRGMRPIGFTNKKIQSCQDCDGEFYLKEGAELTCVNCGRIEIFDGTAFEMRKTYNGRRTTRKYTFKYRLHKLLESCFYPTQLYPSQIDEANCFFEHIQETNYQSKYVIPIVIYKILEQIITKEPQLMILKYIKTIIPASTYLKHEQTWNDLIYANYVMP